MTQINFTILAVDDDADDIEIFCEAVTEVNAAITCLIAQNGNEALTLLREAVHLPQIIFIDSNMPQMNGKKCLTAIKSDDRLQRIPVVMYSTFFSEEDISHFQNMGVVVAQKRIKFRDIVQHISDTICHFYPDRKV